MAFDLPSELACSSARSGDRHQIPKRSNTVWVGLAQESLKDLRRDEGVAQGIVESVGRNVEAGRECTEILRDVVAGIECISTLFAQPLEEVERVHSLHSKGLTQDPAAFPVEETKVETKKVPDPYPACAKLKKRRKNRLDIRS